MAQNRTEDKFAPFRYAQYLDDKLPRSSLHPYRGEGHLFVMKLFDRVSAQLLQQCVAMLRR